MTFQWPTKMSRRISDIDTLQDYLIGAREQAEHHAPEVSEVILALAGSVVLFEDANTPLRVRTYRGALANVLYVMINGIRYAFSYNHIQGSVEIRRHSLRGDVVGLFNNRTRPREIIQTFSQLQSFSES